MIKTIIFDIDGVLLDSFNANYKFMSDLVMHFGYSHPTKEFFFKISHYNLYDAIKSLTNNSSQKEINKIAEFGLSNKINRYVELQKLSKDALKIIKILKKKYILSIVTNRIRQGLNETPAFIKIKNYFSIICCYEDTQKHKPDPEPLLYVVNKLNLKPNEAVYIGDAENDIKAGESAGMKVISYKKINDYDAKYWISEFSELPKIISSL